MENQSSIEQEIAQLEKQLAEKKVALSQEKPSDGNRGNETEPTEKDILHGIVSEKIQQYVPQYRPTPVSPVKPLQDDTALSYVLPELKDKVQELVNLVFNKSLDEGIKKAAKSNNAALIDAFHDVLVDELYSVLLERKKLEQLK